jgi:hypothetical protein
MVQQCLYRRVRAISGFRLGAASPRHQGQLFGTMHVSYAVLPIFLRRRTRVLINTISLGAWMPIPFAAAYTASKFGPHGFTASLRQELADVAETFVDLVRRARHEVAVGPAGACGPTRLCPGSGDRWTSDWSWLRRTVSRARPYRRFDAP